jgi:hypothetical protein
MSKNLLRKICRTGCDTAKSGAQALISRLKPSSAMLSVTAGSDEPKTGALNSDVENRRPKGVPEQATIVMLHAERSGLLEQITRAATQGIVPDGLPRQLLANHEAERAEHRRLLEEDRQHLCAGLRGLNARYPAPPPPEPQPPVQPKPRSYPSIGDLLGQRPAGRLH